MYGISLVTGPTSEPVTLGEAKDHLRVTSSDDEGLIAGYLLAARKYVERITDRVLSTKTLALTLDAFPFGPFTAGYYERASRSDNFPQGLYSSGQAIRIPRAPIQSISSITYYDSTGTQQTLAPANYQLDVTQTPCRLVPSYGNTWPTIQIRVAGVVVTFVAGYTAANFPDELRMAILLLVGHWYQNREAVNTDSRFSTELPLGFEELIDDHRLIWLA